MPAHPDASLLEHLTDIYLAANRSKEIRTRWERAYPDLFGRTAVVDEDNLLQAKDVARVLMAIGVLVG